MIFRSTTKFKLSNYLYMFVIKRLFFILKTSNFDSFFTMLYLIKIKLSFCEKKTKSQKKKGENVRYKNS
jgi:hypothetical protein